MSEKRYPLRSGEWVTSKDGTWPTQYTNRTQAERAAAKIPGSEVIQRGRPFYVRITTADDARQESAADLADALKACTGAVAVTVTDGPVSVTTADDKAEAERYGLNRHTLYRIPATSVSYWPKLANRRVWFTGRFKSLPAEGGRMAEFRFADERPGDDDGLIWLRPFGVVTD